MDRLFIRIIHKNEQPSVPAVAAAFYKTDEIADTKLRSRKARSFFVLDIARQRVCVDPAERMTL